MTHEIEIIAELGVNFRSLGEAKDMIVSAANAGVDSVKFQAFLPEHVAGHPKAKELLECSIDKQKAEELMRWASDVDFFVTPFYPEAVDFLEEVGVKKYKIREKDARILVSEDGSSSPVEATPLIKRIMETRKPVYMSVQRKPLDMHWMYHPQVSWLYCVPKYPTPLEDLELWKCFFDYGFSCHTPEVVAPVTAAVMMMHAKTFHGSKVIEVHVSNEPKSDYVDGNVSFNFEELAQVVKMVRAVEKENLERPF